MKIMLVRDRNVLNNNWLIYFANLLQQNGHEVIIACDTYGKIGQNAPGHELNPAVKLINVNAPTTSKIQNLYRKVRGKILPSWFRFDKLIKAEKPDVIICYFPVDLYNVTRMQNHQIPIIQMLHGYPPRIINKVLKKPQWLKKWYQKSYAQVNTYQVLMESYKATIDEFFAPKNIVRIANPVEQYADNEIIDLSAEKHKIIYVARIEREIKRPHLLVEAFSQIAKDFPEWQVEIWGMSKYPAYEAEINNFIKAHHLEKQVFLRGFTPDVLSVYKNADIHAFPSSGEGFSLAIADGMSLGLPHIGYDYAYSVNEIIVDGHNGFLCKDTKDFAQKLKRLMSDKELRIKFGKNAHEDMKLYAPEKIMQQWEDLLQSIVRK